MNGSTWILLGSMENSRNPLRALLLAPLLSLIPALTFIAFWVINGTSKEVGAGSALIIFYALLLSYGLTLLYGLPVFFVLSKLGCAGLLPILVMGVLPGALYSIGAQQSDAGLLVGMAIASGFVVSGGFWFIARRA